MESDYQRSETPGTISGSTLGNDLVLEQLEERWDICTVMFLAVILVLAPLGMLLVNIGALLELD